MSPRKGISSTAGVHGLPYRECWLKTYGIRLAHRRVALLSVLYSHKGILSSLFPYPFTCSRICSGLSMREVGRRAASSSRSRKPQVTRRNALSKPRRGDPVNDFDRDPIIALVREGDAPAEPLSLLGRSTRLTWNVFRPPEVLHFRRRPQPKPSGPNASVAPSGLRMTTDVSDLGLPPQALLGRPRWG